MHLIVPGGAGFVGSNLALALRAAFPDAQITCLDNLYRRGSELNVPRLEQAGIRFVRGDVRDPACFTALPPFDLMIECSAEPSVLAGQDGSPDYLFHTNLVGAYHCLEACLRHNAGMLFLSTSRVYPIAALEAQPWLEEETRFAWEDADTPGLSSRGVSESLPLEGARSLYGFTKLAAEQLIAEYRATYGLRAVINRCGVLAGPWQFGKVDQGVVGLWVMAHHFGRPLSYIGYGGQGKQVRDLLHVHDLCDLVIKQVRHFDAWDGWCGNVSGGLENSASLQELTALCQEITGNAVPIASIKENRPSDLRLFIADCTRLQQKLTTLTSDLSSPTSSSPSPISHLPSPIFGGCAAAFPRRSVRDIIEDTHTWVKEHQTDLRALNA